MNDYRQEPGGDEPSGLEGAVESLKEVRDGIELSVRLRNPLDRAIHYIADVRAIVFDPVTGGFRVALSDRGRESPPGGVAMQPRFRSVDPHSEAVVTVKLPKTIVKLADVPPGADEELLFEEHALTDAASIELDIGWADTPFYRDPREKTARGVPVAAWEQESLRVTFAPPVESD